MFSATMMLGLATATMVESTRIMKKPTSMAHSAGHGLTGCPDAAVVISGDAASRYPGEVRWGLPTRFDAEFDTRSTGGDSHAR